MTRLCAMVSCKIVKMMAATLCLSQRKTVATGECGALKEMAHDTSLSNLRFFCSA